MKTQPDLRSHLVFSLMILHGFFKDDKKRKDEMFNKDFFIEKLKESEDYVQGFLSGKNKLDVYDLFLNLCGLSYAKKVMKVHLPDESFHRDWLKEVSVTPKLSLKARLQILIPWMRCSGYLTEGD